MFSYAKRKTSLDFDESSLATVECIALSGLRQFLAAESPLKMMKNIFVSSQKFCSLKFLTWHFGHIEKRLDQKNKVIRL